MRLAFTTLATAVALPTIAFAAGSATPSKPQPTETTKVCEEGRWNVLWVVPKPPSGSYKLYARRPQEITEDLAENLYGEYGKELV